MTKNIGFIGVGHFAGYLVEGLSAFGPASNILLSPRNHDKSKELSERYGCKIASDNQQVIDQSDVIFISVKPNDLTMVLEELNFDADKLIISVVAGSKPDQINPLVHPANAVCALPISCAAINKSPTLLYPENDLASCILSKLGSVITFETIEQFTTASAYSAFYGWIFKLAGEMTRWGKENGLDSDVARMLSEQTIQGAASMSVHEKDRTLEGIIKAVATKGGITELGLNVIDGHDGFDHWQEAMSAVEQRLKGK